MNILVLKHRGVGFLQAGWKTESLWKKGEQIVKLVKRHGGDWPASSMANISESEE